MTEYDFSVATVVYEIDLMLSSQSGRDKHVDPDEQGAWLTYALLRGLRADIPDGVGLDRIRFVGSGSTDRDAIVEEEIGSEIGPYDEDVIRNQVWTLQGIVRRLSELISQLDQEKPEAVDAALEEQFTWRQEIIETVEWALGNRDPEDISNDDWGEALRDFE